MSLGGENIRDSLTQRERDLLDEAWIWRAIQLLAASKNTVLVQLDGREMTPIITTTDRIYRLPTDTQKFLDDARRAL